MIAVLWPGRPPDAKLVELMRGRGIRIADGAEGDAVAEIVTAGARAATADGQAAGA